MGGLNKKITVTIVVLIIIICGSIGGYGLYLNSQIDDSKKKIVDDNPNKELLYKGKLYFYDNDELIGTYTCSNLDGYCGYAYEYNDDELHGLNYYEDGEVNTISLINGRYAFLSDTEIKEDDEYHHTANVILYDVVEERITARYRYVKNYTVGIENNYFIVQSDSHKWGVIQLGAIITLPIPFEYDFIGLQNQLTDGIVDADLFSVRKGNEYYLVDKNNATLTSGFHRKISSYNGRNVVTSEMGIFYYNNYEGETLLNGQGFRSLTFISKYLSVVTEQNAYYIYDAEMGMIISGIYTVHFGSKETSKVLEDGSIEMYIDDELKETVKI